MSKRDDALMSSCDDQKKRTIWGGVTLIGALKEKQVHLLSSEHMVLHCSRDISDCCVWV